MHRSTIMKTAWFQYRQMTRYRVGFDRKLFADVLRFVWSEAKRREAAAAARRAREIEAFVSQPAASVALVSELEQRIDSLKYLSARYDIGRMALEIRAEHARQTGAVL